MRRINSAVIGFASVFVMVAGSGRAEMGAQQMCADQSSFVVAAAEKEQAPSGGVEERAVPRTAPGGPGKSVPPKLEGAVIQGKQLKASPGFVLQKGPKNQVMVRRAGGGPGGLSATHVTCGCLGEGTCTLEVGSGVAWCEKGPTGTCNGTCEFTTITTEHGVIMQ
jgi:hypothetical protein